MATLGVLAFSTAVFFNRDLGERLTKAAGGDWGGISRWWAALPMVLLLAHGLLKANWNHIEAMRTVKEKAEAEFIARHKPLFVLTLGQAITTNDGRTTVVTLAARVINQGAESAIIDWAAHYKSPTLDADVSIGRMTVGSVTFAPPGSHALVLRDSDNLINKTAPIPRGGFVNGRLLIEIPGVRGDEITAGAEIVVTVADYLGNQFSSTFMSSGRQKEIQVFPGENVLPSASIRRP